LVGGGLFYERDTRLFYYPLTAWFAEQLQAGRLPLWLPHIFGGYPLLADGEVGPLYPLNLLLLPFLPFGTAFILLRAIHTAVAAVLCYLLLRTFGTGGLAALLAGLVFAFGSFLVSQLHHENMVRSAVWLPGELLLLERAFRGRGWARQRWLVASGLLLGVASLGIHIQAVAMSLVALGMYAVYRLAFGPFRGSWRERLLMLVWAPGLVFGLGLAVAAAQWLPLFELGRTSFRGPGLRFDLAATYALSPLNLPSLLFPYFFRGQDGLWWSLWAPWEILPYVGVAPLALGLLGLLNVRRWPVGFFAALAAAGLWIAMSYYAPLNLHELLWQLPGLSSLRAPGRFTYLFVLGMAGLAAFGVEALVRRWGDGVALLGALCLGLALVLPVGFFMLHGRLLADPGWGQQAAEVRYLSLPRQNPDLQPYQVYAGLLHALSFGNRRTLLALLLLAATGLLLIAHWRRPARSQLWATALVGLAGVDLLAFASGNHRRISLENLTALPPVAGYLAEHTRGEHVFAEPVLPRLEPNRLVLAGVWDLNGYSSLQSQRHWEYVSSVDRQENALFDIWNGRYYVSPARRTDVVVVEGTAFRPYELLMSGGADNPTGREAFRIEPFESGEVRILAALTNALRLPQGASVAEVTLLGTRGERVELMLRAGIEVSEHAIDRGDVAPIVAHGRARAIHGLLDQDPTGRSFTSNIYYSSFVLSPPFAVQDVLVRCVAEEGYLRLWGLGLVEPGSQRVRSLFADDKTKYGSASSGALYRDGEAVVFRNAAAFPRAFVVPQALVRRTRTEQTAIARMALRPFDPSRQAILEEGPFDDLPLAEAALPDTGTTVPPAAAEVFDRTPENILVRARGPGVLVLTDAYHRGWRAYLDGREVPLYLANYVARAVALPSGDHEVELAFDPLSWRLGRAISLAAFAFALLVLSSKFFGRKA
jgi:hypothetical protein